MLSSVESIRRGLETRRLNLSFDEEDKLSKQRQLLAKSRLALKGNMALVIQPSIVTIAPPAILPNSSPFISLSLLPQTKRIHHQSSPRTFYAFYAFCDHCCTDIYCSFYVRDCQEFTLEAIAPTCFSSFYAILQLDTGASSPDPPSQWF